MKKVKQVAITPGMSVAELAKEMAETGVMGSGRLGKAVGILKKAINDKDCRLFFGCAGAMIPGGMRNIIIDLLDYTDVFVTTGAMLTHDLAEAFGYTHLQGSCNASDEELHKQGYDRMFDSYMPNEVYEKLEDFFAKHYDGLQNAGSIKEFLWKLGSLAPKNSILHKCYAKKIPLFCPAIADSGIGLMMWGQLAKGKSCKINAFEDMKEIMDIAFTSRKNCVFYIGGGVPKNFIQQAMQLAPNAASSGVQITMDRPEPGGSSGAELREGISWGKLNPKAEYVDVICDATIALPVILAVLKDSHKK